jgi:glycosyltransferase involved in cell wall biosynthesis
LYAGSFYANRNPAFFLRGFASWLRTKPQHVKDNIQVVFYGPPSPTAQTIVYEEDLQDHVLFKGMIPQNELVPKQKGAHLLLLIIGFDAESRGTVTSKVFEYMACRNPILAIIPRGDAMDILKKYPKLYPVDREDTDMLKLQLDEAYALFEKSSYPSFTPPKPATTDYNPANLYNARNQTRTIASIFTSLMS